MARILETITFTDKPEIADIQVTEEGVKIQLGENHVVELNDLHSSDCCEHVYADWSMIGAYKQQLLTKTCDGIVIKGVKGEGLLICFDHFESVGVNGQERTAKFAIAFLRVMWQCEQFLLTGQFRCNLTDSDLFPLLKKIKPLSVRDIQVFLPEIVAAMSDMDMRVAKAEGDASKAILNMKPYLDWIEEFVYRAYTNND